MGITRRDFLKKTAAALRGHPEGGLSGSPEWAAAVVAALPGREGLVPETEASITVNFDRVIGDIDPRIYGHFVEHLGACAYGGIWMPSGSSVKTLRGMRRDVLEILRRIKPPIVRWPGGCFSEHYHWEDGIGPLNQRPWRFDWVWKKPEPNAVGTHEFMDFCKEVGCDPLTVVNVRTGTPQEAAAWVEYCNGPASSRQGARRAANRHAQPFGVKYWGVGNEAWDLGVEESAKRYVAFHDAMKAVDPGIRLVAIGSAGWNEEWNRKMIEIAGDKIDYLAPHHYDGWGNPQMRTAAPQYYANMASAVRIADTIRLTAALLDEMLPHRPEAGVCLDEWGIWTYGEQGVQHDYDLSDALVAACVFNAMLRHSRRVKMACWAQLVNCLGLIQANEADAWPTAVCRAFELYVRHCTGQAVETAVSCGTFDVDPALRPGLTGIPYLDVSATRDGGRYTLAVVNRHADREIKASLILPGLPQSKRVEVETLNGPDMFTRNTAREPERVSIGRQELDAVPGQYAFASHSVTVLSVSA